MKKGLFSSQFFLAGWERVNPSSQFDSRIVKYTLFCFFGLKCDKIFWQARKNPYFLLIPGPSNASWRSWSNWSSCSGNCKTRGEAVPKKFRSRTCIPEKFGGKNCSFLEDQARMNQQPLHKEEHECFELPDCPRNATLGPWGEWSPCTQTCYQENGSIPQTQRTKPCQEASLSLDHSLNDGIVTCKDLQEVNKESKDCDINVCPGKSNITANHANFQC